jgi:preprotein translocase subunit SecA
MARQELVKKNKARAISVAEGAINPMAPAGFLRFYYQGQEFEIASRSGPRLQGATRRRRSRITSR